MPNEWKDLPTFQDVAEAQAQGWEIQRLNTINPNLWSDWDGCAWVSHWALRGRPRQPKMKKVKQLCFFSPSGNRYDILENSDQHSLISHSIGWIRAPSEDKEIEVPA